MSMPVSALLDDDAYDLRLDLLAGEAALVREIQEIRVERPGLILVGEVPFVEPGRLQVLGDHEMAFLTQLSEDEVQVACRNLVATQPAGVLVAGGFAVPRALKEAAEGAGIPLLSSPHGVNSLIDRLAEFLRENLGESCSLHGVLVDVMGVGVLMLGKSGIGKSECALDLVLRGHRLVADDVVELKLHPPATIFGGCTALLGHHMEIRGLGVINIKDLYGVSAVRSRKKLELVVELVDGAELDEIDQLGVEDRTYNLLGVELPYLVVPVRPGRNITTVVEVAARNLLLKRQGHHSAREFQEKLRQEIRGGLISARSRREDIE